LPRKPLFIAVLPVFLPVLSTSLILNLILGYPRDLPAVFLIADLNPEQLSSLWLTNTSSLREAASSVVAGTITRIKVTGMQEQQILSEEKFHRNLGGTNVKISATFALDNYHLIPAKMST